MIEPRIPQSACTGIGWPALPAPQDAAILALLQQFEQSQWWPPETLLAAQLRQLETVLAHAAETVPYYRERLRPVARLKPGELTLEMWRRLPILRRRDVHEAGPALVSRWLPEDHGPANDVRTSGSTGRPIDFKTTKISDLLNRAAHLRFNAWQGWDFAGKVACIRFLEGREATAAAAGTSLRWVSGYPSGPMYFFDVSAPVGEQLDWLVRIDPDYLLTFPTNLAALVRLSEATGARPAKLRAACTQSEVLDGAVRTACERVWGIGISDAYSVREAGPIALQCPDHLHYHVHAEGVLLEVLRDDGTACEPGEQGRVVVSSLNNFATPFIRYEVGDYAEVGEPCPCGRGLPVLNRILGRVRNMATLPNGEQFWPSVSFGHSYIIDIAPITQFQYVQKSLEHIEARLVVERALTPEEEEQLRERIVSRFGYPFEVTFTYHDEIPRGAGGKFEEFKSELGEGADAP